MAHLNSSWMSVGLLVLACGGAAAAQETRPAAGRAPAAVVWNERNVEHLLNRAGFGARPVEIGEGVILGAAALVDKLVTQRTEVEPFFVEPIMLPNRREMLQLSHDDQQKAQREYREKDRAQLFQYMGWWFERMASGEDPLREKMVLFWHGFFTTSAEEVKRGVEVLKQNQFVREHAMGSYADLLNGIARDPAMLVYLNNNVNRKGNPNENFARELMELFSLGVGNYTEKDIKEAARALTGRTVTREGVYLFTPRMHDDGEKTVLGVTGKLDGDDVVKILLEQDACATWVAKKIITYFEGVEPAPARLREYAAFLRESQYQVQPFLKRLFLDPAFYRDEIVGARVQGPVEYMVGTARRLAIKAPPVILATGAALLGQRLFAPPSVKGWEEGEAWITTASLMQRGNLAGMLLGVVKLDDVLSQADLEESAPLATDEPKMGGDDDPSMEGQEKKTPPEAGRTDKVDGKDAREGKDPSEGKDKLERRYPAKGAAKGGQKGGGFAYQALRRMEANGWTPSINFTARMQHEKALSDEAIVDRMLDELLAIQAPADTQKKMRDFLVSERASLSVKDGHLFDAGAEAERVLRRLAHLILSLPEAQLG